MLYSKKSAVFALLLLPFALIAEEDGKVLYEKNCSKCHGPTGHGDGPVSKFIKTIANLTSAEAQKKTDQQIFDFITQGKDPMPSFKDLPEESRWAIVKYVRTLGSK
jgi:high-affinity iron transporter